MGNKVDIVSAGAVGLSQFPQSLSLDSRTQIIAISLSAALGLSFSVWSYFSDKRNKELFHSEEFVQKLIQKAAQSDDFASFIFDVWQKHNLESSEERRQILKQFLEKEADKPVNEFENFSKVNFIIQNINLRALKLLAIIHSDAVQRNKVNFTNPSDNLLTLQKLIPIVQSVYSMHEQDIELFMTELSNLGLLCPLYGRFNGTFYIEAKLGYVLLSYIRE